MGALVSYSSTGVTAWQQEVASSCPMFHCYSSQLRLSTLTPGILPDSMSLASPRDYISPPSGTILLPLLSEIQVSMHGSFFKFSFFGLLYVSWVSCTFMADSHL